MKRFFFSFISFLVLCVSCTDNDNTGDLYGQWQLTTVKDNGIILSTPANLSLSFQGDIVFARVSDHQDYRYRNVPGVFYENNDSLILSFYIDDESSRSIITRMFLMEDEPADLRFALKKSSGKIMLTKGNRCWQLRNY